LYPPTPSESENAECGKHDGGRNADGFHREPVGDPVADEHGRDVRQHYAERCAGDDRMTASLTLLDIACGTGNQQIANRNVTPNARFVGLDGSAGMASISASGGLVAA
jgi:hypothetical protein